MQRKTKLKIATAVIGAVGISSLIIGLGVGLSNKNNVINSTKNDSGYNISTTNDTYDYYGTSNPYNSVITFSLNNSYNQANLSVLATTTVAITYQ